MVAAVAKDAVARPDMLGEKGREAANMTSQYRETMQGSEKRPTLTTIPPALRATGLPRLPQRRARVRLPRQQPPRQQCVELKIMFPVATTTVLGGLRLTSSLSENAG